MSKAEDLAEKLYPKKEHVAFGPLPCEEPNVIDDNKPYRIGFIAGYHQAEKDNELTWEDIKEICVQSVLVEIDLGGLVSDERHYTEVLKRFKERSNG